MCSKRKRVARQAANLFMRMAIIGIIDASKIDVGCEGGAGQSLRFIAAAARGKFRAVGLVYVM